MNQAPVIAARQLSKHYGEIVGLEALDLVVERGEVFGFLGPNGESPGAAHGLRRDDARGLRSLSTARFVTPVIERFSIRVVVVSGR